MRPEVKEAKSLTRLPRYWSQYADIKLLFVLKTSTHTCFQTYTHRTNDTISKLFSLNGKEAQQDLSKVYRLFTLFLRPSLPPTCNMIQSHVKVEEVFQEDPGATHHLQANGKENEEDVVARRRLPKAWGPLMT